MSISSRGPRLLIAGCALLAACRVPPPTEAPSPRPPAAAAPAAAPEPALPAATVDPKRDAILKRAAEYVQRFEEEFALVLSDETYTQRVAYSPPVQGDSRPAYRRIRSEMLFLRPDEERRAMAVRNVLQVDDRAIPDSRQRLEALLHASATDRAHRLRELLDESARFNLGGVFRNISDATSVLRYLDPVIQPRFVFTLEGEVDVIGLKTWRVAFAERQRPTIIQHNGQDFPSTGWALIDQADGAVIATLLQLGAEDVRAAIAVDYRQQASLDDLWVPSRMEEQYVTPGSPHESIHCVATYSNFRHFETTARLLPPVDSPATAPATPSEATDQPDAAASGVEPTAESDLGASMALPIALDARETAPLMALPIWSRRPADVGRLAFSGPRAVAELDGRVLKGDPAALSWSPDGKQLYLQTVVRDVDGRVIASSHYVIAVDGGQMTGIDIEPAWAASYWNWKSSHVSPASPGFQIDVDVQHDMVSATNFQGALGLGSPSASARGAQGMSASEVANAASAAQTVMKTTLSVNGASLGDWTNENVVPGLTFGWAPPPWTIIAFAKETSGALTLLDDAGRTRTVPGTKSVLLPGWSVDGSRIAWLERRKNKRFDVMIGGVEDR